jgi:tetratricopeptide (TPR) repeat protein
MKKILSLCAALILFAVPIYGQDLPRLRLTEKKVELDIPAIRCMSGNGAVVQIQSNVLLNFESTVDKAVGVCEFDVKNGFYYYMLRFPTGREYSERTLEIYCYGFETYMLPIELKAKDHIGFLVTNETKRIADSLYIEGKYSEALKEYEKLYSINPNDEFVKTRIQSCSVKPDSVKPNSAKTDSVIPPPVPEPRPIIADSAYIVTFMFKSVSPRLSAKLYLDNKLIGETNFRKGFQLNYPDNTPGLHNLRIVWNRNIATWRGVIDTGTSNEFKFEYKRTGFGYRLELAK